MHEVCVMIGDEDENGCWEYYLHCDSIEIFECNLSMDSQITHTDSTAATGAIDITMQDGAPPYEFLWSNDEITEDITGLISGEYFLTVIDSVGCEIAQNFIIDESGSGTGDPCNIEVTAQVYNITHPDSCDGGIELQVDFFAPPLTFNWSNSSTNQNIYD